MVYKSADSLLSINIRIEFHRKRKALVRKIEKETKIIMAGASEVLFHKFEISGIPVSAVTTLVIIDRQYVYYGRPADIPLFIQLFNQQIERHLVSQRFFQCQVLRLQPLIEWIFR